MSSEQVSSDPIVTSPTLTRWRWQANSGGRTYHLRLDALHVDADPDRFPYIAGQQLTLEWIDTFYPPNLGRSGDSERFLPHHEFRYERPEHLAGPFWSQQITDDLAVNVRVAKPAVLHGDDMRAESVLHVSYQSAGRTWNVTPTKTSGPSVVLPAVT